MRPSNLPAIVLSLCIVCSTVGCTSEGQDPCDLYEKHCGQSPASRCEEQKRKAVQQECKKEYKAFARCEINACREYTDEGECPPKRETFQNCLEGKDDDDRPNVSDDPQGEDTKSDDRNGGQTNAESTASGSDASEMDGRS